MRYSLKTFGLLVTVAILALAVFRQWSEIRHLDAKARSQQNLSRGYEMRGDFWRDRAQEAYAAAGQPERFDDLVTDDYYFLKTEAPLDFAGPAENRSQDASEPRP